MQYGDGGLWRCYGKNNLNHLEKVLYFVLILKVQRHCKKKEEDTSRKDSSKIVVSDKDL